LTCRSSGVATSDSGETPEDSEKRQSHVGIVEFIFVLFGEDGEDGLALGVRFDGCDGVDIGLVGDDARKLASNC